MFNKIGDMYRMQKQAREMQKKMKGKQVTGASKQDLVKVMIDGTQEIQEVYVDESLLSPDNKSTLENGIKQAFKDAQNKLQKEMMKDLDMGQIKDMLGM